MVFAVWIQKVLLPSNLIHMYQSLHSQVIIFNFNRRMAHSTWTRMSGGNMDGWGSAEHTQGQPRQPWQWCWSSWRSRLHSGCHFASWRCAEESTWPCSKAGCEEHRPANKKLMEKRESKQQDFDGHNQMKNKTKLSRGPHPGVHGFESRK